MLAEQKYIFTKTKKRFCNSTADYLKDALRALCFTAQSPDKNIIPTRGKEGSVITYAEAMKLIKKDHPDTFVLDIGSKQEKDVLVFVNQHISDNNAIKKWTMSPDQLEEDKLDMLFQPPHDGFFLQRSTVEEFVISFKEPVCESREGCHF